MCPVPGGEPARVLPLRFLLTSPSSWKRRARVRQNAHQHAGSDSARHLSGSARLSALCGPAQPGAFRQRGVPFTRRADLSETTVVLPPKPTKEEIETCCHADGPLQPPDCFPPPLRGQRGGVPTPCAPVHETDFLILAPATISQPSHPHCRPPSPCASEKCRSATLWHSWRPCTRRGGRPIPASRSESGDLTAGGVPDSLIEGIKSPFGPAGTEASLPSTSRMPRRSALMASFPARAAVKRDLRFGLVLHGVDFHRSARADAYMWACCRGGPALTLWLMQVPWLGPIVVLGLAIPDRPLDAPKSACEGHPAPSTAG